MIYKNGTKSKIGDIIRWKCFDSDDFVTWTLTGLVAPAGVVYLGGGVDFGMGIGQTLPVASVIEESENNDPNERGIEKIGEASDLAKHIAVFGRGQ